MDLPEEWVIVRSRVRTHPVTLCGQVLVPEAEFSARVLTPLRPPPVTVFGTDGDANASEEAGELVVRIGPGTAQAVWETLRVLSHRGGRTDLEGREALGVLQDGRQSRSAPNLPAN